jgi:hypothetical protein
MTKTLVTLLLDRSSSMQSIKLQTVTAINAWLAELRKSQDDMRFSLVQFDYGPDAEPASEIAPAHAVPASTFLGGARRPTFGAGLNVGSYKMQLEKTYEAVPVKEVPDLTAEMFQPRGGTPLIDAAFTTIRAVEASIAGRTDVKVVLAIQTDGQEMHSRENTWEDLRSLVAEKEAAGWEILFMGAGIDAYNEASKMGVSRDKTLSYGNDMAQTRAAFETTAAKTVMFSSGAAQSMAYTSAEKLRAGDAS